MENNDVSRKQELKEIIKSLNSGENPEIAKKNMTKRFSRLLKTLSPEEIAEAEQALIQEGMEVAEVQKLCEIHVDAFEQTLNKNSKNSATNQAEKEAKIPGHPVATFKAENAALKKELKKFALALGKCGKGITDEARKAFESVSLVLIHYERKENQLFPYLEAAGFTGPSKVMWGKHNEIRETLRSVRKHFEAGNVKDCQKEGKALIRSLKRMIFMEEKILFPTALKKLSKAIWISIRRGESAIGYAWVKSGNLWDPNVVASRDVDQETKQYPVGGEGLIQLKTGQLSPSQIDLMLTNLPLDISFVDENDLVRYYSDNKDRIFPRSPGVIGRAVQNCHPSESVHVVQKIIDDFKAGKRKEAEFWIQMRGKFIHIRYFPLFEGNAFKGIIEVTQDITAIHALEGEKRLLDPEIT